MALVQHLVVTISVGFDSFRIAFKS